MEHFGDRLTNAIRERKAPVCVGLDPVPERFPRQLLADHGLIGSGDATIRPDASTQAIADAMLEYGHAIIEATAPIVPSIKINIAFFEPLLAEGIRCYFRLVHEAQRAGLIVIGDVKRADIGHSSTQYARAQLGRIQRSDQTELATPDAVTVNAYFGYDTLAPFVDIARDEGRGIFALVQTSNASAVEIQGLTLEGGEKLCERVAQIVQAWSVGEGLVGKSGYSCLGAVVSPRDLESTIRIRANMPNCILLVPGFGAQGRSAEEVAKCFKPDGTGAIVNASRSVIYAYQNADRLAASNGDWRRCVTAAAEELVSAVRAAAGM